MKLIAALVACMVIALAVTAVVRWGSAPSPAYQQYANCITANPGAWCPPPGQN